MYLDLDEKCPNLKKKKSCLQMILIKDDKLSAFDITVEKLIRMRKKTLEVDIMMMISRSVVMKDAFDITVEKLKNEKPLVEMIL